MLRRKPTGSANLMPASGATTPYVVMYIGSSTTEGVIGAADEHHNYVNQFSPMVVANAMDSISTRKVVKQNSGTYTRPTTNGLWFFNAGIGGRTAVDYVDSGVQALAASITPNLFIHMVGSNDYKDQVNPATYQSNMQTAINNLRSRSAAGAKHILVHSYVRLDVTGAQTYEWDAYKARLTALANANADVTMIAVDDLFAAQGVYKGSNDPNDLIHDGDGIHCTNAGYKFLAECMALRLGMNVHRGEKIWELDPDTLSTANGAEVLSWPTKAGTLEQTPAVSSSGSAPVMQTNSLNGHKTLKFDGSNDSIASAFSKSYGLPVTIFIVVKTNTGGSSPRPIFSRTTTDHMGYIYAFDQELTGDNSALQAMSNAGQAKVAFTISKSQWMVMAVVFRASDEQAVYTNNINPRAEATRSTDLSQGPFISSLRLASNTGLTNFSPMELAYARLFQGELTQSEIEANLYELGSRFGVTISTTPWPGKPPEPATGDTAYSNNFDGSDRDLTADGWVDRSYSSGTYKIYQGRLVPSGVANYRTYNCYYYPQAINTWQWARVTISAPPSSADARGGIGLVLRHDTTKGVFFKVATNGNWYIYGGTSDNADQTDPTTLLYASGSLPAVLMQGDELIATCENDVVYFYLNNTLLNTGGTTISGMSGQYTGVLISQTNAGELSGFSCGAMATAPDIRSYTPGTYTVTAPSNGYADVGVIGGGGGGATGDNGLSTANGKGGSPASWSSKTIAVNAGDVITLNIGSGGPGASGSVKKSGTAGSNSTASGPNLNLTSTGGLPGTGGTANGDRTGRGATASSINGLTLPGSDDVSTNSVGNTPGGGGTGGDYPGLFGSAKAGYKGGDGLGLIRFRKS